MGILTLFAYLIAFSYDIWSIAQFLLNIEQKPSLKKLTGAMQGRNNQFWVSRSS